MTVADVKHQGVGARLRRKEDQRFLAGEGEYVGNIKLPGMMAVAFVRSPIAHGRIVSIEKPAGHEHAVFTMDDLTGVSPIRAVTRLAGFKPSEQWPLAKDKVRQVGEMIAMCVAPTRAEAEDIAQQVFVDFEELPAVVDMLTARTDPPALVHEAWGDNLFLTTLADDDLSDIKRTAAVKINRQLRTARQSMAPMEGRGVVCEWNRRLNQLVMHSAAQMPHINRAGLSECLGIDQASIRVIAPDVGGGFGYKGILLPEEICLGWLARHLGKPVKWIEDRREQLSANANCREHAYDITVYGDANGRLLAIDCEATVDSGAYSSYPFSACLEAAQVASILPGPYKMDGYRCKAWSVATNKPPILPYRGVARTDVCFALEVMIDAMAREVGIEPHEARLRSIIQADEMPYNNITKKHFDSGDYPQAILRAVDALDIPKWRALQSQQNATQDPDNGKYIGIGMAVYCEQAAHGTSVYFGWGIPMVPGHEQCGARLTPDGMLELRIGAHSHGQGLETTLAQVANQVMGISPAHVRVVHGDTGMTPYSTGTWGSRCMVMSGGAVAEACKHMLQRVKHIAAKVLELPAESLVFSDGLVSNADGSKKLTLGEVAHIWYRQPQLLPADVDPSGLEVTVGYKAKVDTGTFSYACHAVAVSVDTGTGHVEILDYVVVEDAGVMVNPMIVDGQILGGLAQGIGTALYEEMPYDEQGQPLASTLADYTLPGATEVPTPRIIHMETPSPYTTFGQKGVGEGGAIAPPAAIANAVNDALKTLKVEVTELPITPRRLLQALAARQGAQTGEVA
jgi:carbon-monoxide dehydrogenase large subunit